ncbi:hypothetical protein AAZX31_05G188800 [Glycine max]
MDFSQHNSSEMDQFYTKYKNITQVSKNNYTENRMIQKMNLGWDKCLTGTPGGKFSSSESTCLSNCAHRYIEMSVLVMKRFQSMR